MYFFAFLCKIIVYFQIKQYLCLIFSGLAVVFPLIGKTTMQVLLQHIDKTFGTAQVLHDVSLSVSSGEVLGLLGPNGAGKSTLMKILIGLLRPDKGQDTLVQCPARVGYLPEQNPLYEDMYVREYLHFMASLTGSGSEVEPLVHRLGLLPEAGKRIRVLSKGYRQRVGLAQALLGNPDLLILDEPTTGLDPNQLLDIRRVIKEEGQHRIVILSTHILQEVREMCSRVVILDHGHIRADQSMEQVGDLELLFRSSTLNHED